MLLAGEKSEAGGGWVESCSSKTLLSHTAQATTWTKRRGGHGLPNEPEK